ncbi:replication initiation factor domain-containing protein [Comamonas testosteroni]|uniref:replication initiation factor domain-containing protein n=1 Tax=Comamonas testosteroni TaxID=285 RepID=UPI00187C81DA|nr:replication initiation factor domain-containing protein [Comamonas testosteroni]
MNATFDQPAMTVHGLMGFIGNLMDKSITAQLDGGLFGFTERHRMTVRLDDGAKVEIGSIALGGESQKGRWLLQLNGKGCGLVADWPSLQELLEGLDATISRVDLAVDFLDGEYSVDDAMTLYHEGAFINRGRNPELDTQGAWHELGTKGRTMYVGKLKNGKTLCVYEKGRQLNMPDSDWTRYEVRLGNRDRVIPLDVLTNPDKYFAGAYPALSHMLQAGAEEIPTVREEVKGSLAHGLHHLQRCYGKYIHQAIETTGVAMADLVEEVRVVGIPKKVEPSGVVAGLAWPELQAQMERLKS